MPQGVDQLFQGINVGFDFAGIFQAVGIGILILGFVVAIYFFRKRSPIKRFPTKVLVYEILKDGKPYPYFTQGRRVGKYSDFQEYELKNGDRTQAFSLRDMTALPNGKKLLILDKLEDGRYIPHKSRLTETKKEIRKIWVDVPNPMDPKKTIKQEKELEYAVNLWDMEIKQDDINHTIEQIRRDIKQFSLTGFWSKYAIPIIIVMAIFANAMLVYISMQYGVLPTLDRVSGTVQAMERNQERQENMTAQWLQSQERQNQQRQQELMIFARILNVSLDGVVDGTVIP